MRSNDESVGMSWRHAAGAPGVAAARATTPRSSRDLVVARGEARRDDDGVVERAGEECRGGARLEVVVGVAAGAVHHDERANDAPGSGRRADSSHRPSSAPARRGSVSIARTRSAAFVHAAAADVGGVGRFAWRTSRDAAPMTASVVIVRRVVRIGMRVARLAT